RGENAHRVHPLLVEERLALLLHLALPPELGGDVVDQGHRLAAAQPLEPDLDHLGAALEPREVRGGRERRRLAAEELAEGLVLHPGVRSVQPPPRTPARVQGGIPGVCFADPAAGHERQGGGPRRLSPAREDVARLGGGHAMQSASPAYLSVGHGRRPCNERIQARSRSTRSAALWPAAPITEPAGWHPALQEYTPAIGVAYGRRSAKPNALSTWWMCPREIPKCCSIFL